MDRDSPGEITARELEREAGSSGLRHSFDIESGASRMKWMSLRNRTAS